MKRILLLCCLLHVPIFLFAQKVFNIVDYGASTDLKTVNTLALQKAVDACHKAGGGTVYVPAGTFMTGTFGLASNVNLYLESGAVLKGTGDVKDYRSYTVAGYGTNYYGILFTENAENVSITGQGTIDGNDTLYFDWNRAKKLSAEVTQYARQKNNYRHVSSGIGDGPVVPANLRPHQMVIFSNCRNVIMKDVTLLNSPFWTLHFADCDAVRVSGLRIWSHLLAPNADGMDVTSSRNVSISDCDIRAGDDAIAITGYDHHFEIPGFKGLRHISENIVISNCNLQSYSSGIRIGFLDQNTVRNVQVSNVNITNSTRGIGIFLRDEGSLENISFSNIYIETKLRSGDWWGNGEPIHISAIRGKENVKLGAISHMSFNHIRCKGENGMLIFGTKESLIRDITFNDVSFQLTDSKMNEVAGGNIDLRGVMGEKNQIFEHDIPGLLISYAKNVRLYDFRLSWAGTRMPYFTHGIEAQNVDSLDVRHFDGAGSPINKKAARILVEHGSNITIDDVKGLVKKN